METFEYKKAIARLEEIAVEVEDPATGIDDIDKYIAESQKLVEQCREYLRTARGKLEK